MNINLYQYKSLPEFLDAYYHFKKERYKGVFTLERWANDVGFKSPRVIAMVMKKQRAPSDEFERKLLCY